MLHGYSGRGTYHKCCNYSAVWDVHIEIIVSLVAMVIRYSGGESEKIIGRYITTTNKQVSSVLKTCQPPQNKASTVVSIALALYVLYLEHCGLSVDKTFAAEDCH